MCFRPPDSSTGPLICPECEKKIVSPNFRPINCPFCSAKLPEVGQLTPPSGGTATTSPGVPKVPSAPKPPAPPA